MPDSALKRCCYVHSRWSVGAYIQLASIAFMLIDVCDDGSRELVFIWDLEF